MELSFDAAYKNGPLDPMPAWFKEGLRENPAARKNWQTLTPSRQKEILRYLAALKTPEARARNLEKTLGLLSGKK